MKTTPSCFGALQRLSLIAAVLMAVTGLARAASVTWSGTSTDFNLAGNWAATLNDTDTAVFGTVGSLPQPQLTASRTVGGLSFGTSGGGWTLSSNSSSNVLTVGAGGVSSAGQNTISANVELGALQTWVVGDPAKLTFTGKLTNASGIASGASLWTVGNSSNKGILVLSPSASNSVVLSASTSSSAPLAVSYGTLVLGGDGSTYGARTTSTNSIINNSGNGAISVAATGTLQVNSGSWYFNALGKQTGGGTFIGRTDLNGGTLIAAGARQLGGNGSVFNVNNGGTFKMSGSSDRFALGHNTGSGATSIMNVNSGGFVDLATNSAGSNYIGAANTANTATVLFNQLGGVVQIGVTPSGVSTNKDLLFGYSAGSSSSVAYTLSGGTLVSAGKISGAAVASGTGINNFNFIGGTLTSGSIDATNLGYSGSATATSYQVNTYESVGTFTNKGGTLAPGGYLVSTSTDVYYNVTASLTTPVAGKTGITGGYTQMADGTLAINISGTTASTLFQESSANSGKYSNVSVSGNVTLGGNLNVNLITGTGGSTFTPASANSFTILTGSSVSGSFANTLTNISLGTGTSKLAPTGINDPFSSAFTVVISSTSVVLSGYAQNEWIGTGGAGGWGTANLWSNGVVSTGSGMGAKFSSLGAANTSVTLDADRAIGQMIFENANYSITGAKTLTFNNGASPATITLNSNSQSIGTAVALQSDLSLTGSAGTQLTISGNIVESGGNRNLTLAAGNRAKLVLAGSNSYTGKTTVSGGSLQLGKSASLYGGDSSQWTADKIVVDNGATLALNVGGAGEFDAAGIDALKALGTDTGGFKNGSVLALDTSNAAGGNFSYSSVIANTNGGSNTLSFNKLGVGTLQLTGANSYTGPTTINGGILQADNLSALGSGGNIIFTGGTLQYTGNSSASDWSTRIKNSTSSVALDTNGQNVTMASSIDSSNTGGLTKGGAGILTLSASNSYTGATTVSGGTLLVNNANALSGAAGKLNISGGILDLGTYNLTRTGTISITSGTVQNGTLTNNTVAYDAQGGGVSAVLAGSVGLTKSGTGIFTLSGFNTYTGLTTVSGGELDLNTAEGGAIAGNLTVNGGLAKLFAANQMASTKNLVVSSGTFDLQNYSQNVANAQLTGGAIVGTTGTLSSSNAYDLQSGSISAVLGGSVGVNKTTSGTVALTGANTYSGTTSVTAGELDLNTSGGNAIAGDLTVNGGLAKMLAASQLSSAKKLTVSSGTFDLQGFNQSAATVQMTGGAIVGTNGTLTSGSAYDLRAGSISAVLGGSVGMNKTTTGTVTLTGANAYSGTTSVTAGELDLNTSGGNAIAGDLTVNGGLAKMLAASQLSSAKKLTISSGTFDLQGFNQSAATVQMTGGVIVGTNGTLTSGSAYDLRAGSISAVLGGSVGMNKTTTGTVTLTGVNTYSGTTSVTAGELDLNTSGGNAIAGDLTVNGGLAKMLAANQLNSAKNLTVSSGTFDLQGFNQSAATLQMTGGAIVGTNGTLTSSSAYDLRAGSVSAVLGGSVGMNKTTSGTVTFTGLNTYSGTTSVSAGELDLNASGGSAIAGDLTVNGGLAKMLAADQLNSTKNLTVGSGTFNLQGFNQSAANVQMTGGAIVGTSGTLNSSNDYDLQAGSISAVLGGSVGMNKTTSGTVTLTGANTYSGLTTVSAGELDLNTSGGNAIAGDLTVNGGLAKMLAANQLASTKNLAVSSGTFNLQGFNQSAAAVQMTGGAIVGTTGTLSSSNAYDLQAGSISAVLGGSVGFNKTTSGTVTLTGANAYSGASSVNGGVLQIGNALALSTGSLTLTSGTISSSSSTSYSLANSFLFNGDAGLGSAINTGALTLSGNVDLGGLTRTLAINSAVTLSGSISNGGIIKNGAGTLTLSGSNTSSEGLTVNSGTLQLADGGSLGSGAVAVNGALQLNRSDIATIANAISGGGTIAKTGAGTVVLTSSNSFSGSTTASAGILQAGDANAFGSSTVTSSGGSLAFSGGIGIFNIGALAGSTALSLNDVSSNAVTLSVGANGSNTTYSGAISGLGGLSKTGGGYLALTASNSFAGGVSLQSGVLRVGNGSALGAGVLTLTGGTMSSNSNTAYSLANNLLINGDVGLGDATNAGNLTFTSNSVDLGNATRTLNINSYVALSGSISNGGIIKNGSGLLQFNALNTFSGGLTVNSGTLRNVIASSSTLIGSGSSGIVSASPTGTGTVTIGSGVSLDSNSGANTWAIQRLNTSGTVAIIGGARQNITIGTWDLGGGTQVNVNSKWLVLTSGTVANEGSGYSSWEFTTGTNSLQNKFQNGVLNLQTTAFSGNAYGAIRLSTSVWDPTTSLNIGGNVMVLSAFGAAGGSTGGPAVNIEAGGIWNMANASSGAAVASLSGAGTVYATLVTSSSNNKTLTLTGTSGTSDFSGSIKDGASVLVSLVLSKTGASTQILSGSNTYTGKTTVSAGVLQFAKTASLYNGDSNQWTAANLTVENGATLALNVGGTGEFDTAGIDMLKALGSSGSGFKYGAVLGLDTSNAGGSFTYASAIANPNSGVNLLGLTKLGTGTLKLTGSNTYTGATTVSAGTLQIGDGGTTGSLGNTNITNKAALVFNRSNDSSYSNSISGTGTLTKQGAGTLTLSGSSGYTGATAVNAGRLLVSGSLAGTTSVSVSSGAELKVNGLVNTNATIALAGTLSGSGRVGNVTLQSGAVLAPGNSPGTLTTDTLVLAPGGTYNLEINGTSGVAGTNWDQIVASTLDLTQLDSSNKFTLSIKSLTPENLTGAVAGFDYKSSYTWAGVLRWTNLNGTFDSSLFAIDSSGFSGGYGTFSIVQNSSQIDLQYAIPEPSVLGSVLSGLGMLLLFQRGRRRLP